MSKENASKLWKPGMLKVIYELFNDKIIRFCHMYFIICKNFRVGTKILNVLNKIGIVSTFHYLPLHMSKTGSMYSKKKLNVTEELSKKIIRLPLWIGMNQNKVIAKLEKVLND